MFPYDDLTAGYEDMRQNLRKWLQHISCQQLSGYLAGNSGWIPAADIRETERGYHLFVDLAGIDPATIDLTVEGNLLRLSGERQRPQIDACTRIHQLEIDAGPFMRTFQFAFHLDADGASSSYRNGVLEVFLPKQRKVSAIKVSPGAGQAPK